jgi:hypothetical protein
LLAVAVAPSTATGQQRRWQDMPTDYLAFITERWGLVDRRLGLLRWKDIRPGDIELRFWAGYGLVGTGAILLNRTGGQWTARRVRVRGCWLALPPSVADTMSLATRERYEAEARRRCDEPRIDTLSVASVLTSDTLVIETVATAADLARVWEDIVAAGLLRLPTSVHRSAMMFDGHSWVVEVRLGQEYRLSSITSWSREEVPADKAIKVIDQILTERVGWH